MLKKSLLFILFFLLIIGRIFAQFDTIEMTLTDAIRIAQDSSLNAFRSTNMYLSSYWQYKEFLSRKLPTLNFTTSPSSYNRSIERQFFTSDSSYHFIEGQQFSSSAGLSINQNITLTGGSLTMDAETNRLKNSRDNYANFSTVPIRIGIQQPLFSYNSFKWEKKIAPLQFEIAMKTFIGSREDISIQTVRLFFSLLIAEKQLALMRKSLSDADTMFWMGKKRFENGSIEKTDFLTLQLDLVNRKSEAKTKINDYERIRFEFLSFLRLPNDLIIKLIVPSRIPEIILDTDEVLKLAKTNNTEFINLELSKIQAQSDLDRSVRGGRFTANVSASYGFNQSADNFPASYANPNSQQRINLNISIPIIDWGRSKNVSKPINIKENKPI
jgi:hypothetical protein